MRPYPLKRPSLLSLSPHSPHPLCPRAVLILNHTLLPPTSSTGRFRQTATAPRLPEHKSLLPSPARICQCVPLNRARSLGSAISTSEHRRVCHRSGKHPGEYRLP